MKTNFKKLLVGFTSLFLFLFLVSSVSAATFNVNTTVDAVDAIRGDGICETATPGECTLRAAIQEANTTSNTDTINIPAGNYILTIPGLDNSSNTGDLDILNSLSIIGAGSENTIISGGGLDRVFEVYTPYTSTTIFNGIKITGGVAPSATSQEPGGGGVKIRRGYVQIIDSAIVNNKAPNDPNRASMGGGIYSDSGDLTIINSDISYNRAESQNWAYGAGIYFSGKLTVENSTISNNVIPTGFSPSGGGIVAKGNFSINNSTISNNSVSHGDGGGILQDKHTTGIIKNSLLNNNIAHTAGAIHSYGNLEIVNSTVTGNEALGSYAGAIDYQSYYFFDTYPKLTITNSTFYDNYALGGYESIKLDIPAGDAFTITNSIVSARSSNGNYNLGCGFDPQNFNLYADPSCSLQPADLLLGPLQDNGGYTLTHALLQGSPAIDAADSLYCPPADQRGILRPQNSGCDIGSYEAESFNQPPASNAGPDQTVNEGDTVTFDGSGSTDPDGVADIVSYDWDFGDGNTGSGISTTHTYIQDGIYTASLTVTDAANETSTNDVVITVNNAAPIVSNISPVEPVLPNTQINISASFTDAGVADVHTATIDWGDGNTTSGTVYELLGSGTVVGSHAYASNGIYTITLSVSDESATTVQTLQVLILTPGEATNNLVDLVEAVNIQQGINNNSLEAKLNAALNTLDDVNQNNDQAAINSLQSFINAVEAQRGDKITNEQADTLVAAAQAIIDYLSL